MTAFLSGDKTMYEAYNNNKDLYAMIAMSAFPGKTYEDCLEFYPEGTEIDIDGQKVICGKKTHLNKAGKERRTTGKVLNLAATYGMSGPTAGARLGYTGKEAKEKGQELLDNFFTGFSGVKQAIDDSKTFLKDNGYVEDFIGRRRRLKDIKLTPYTVSLKNPVSTFNPFINCTDRNIKEPKVLEWENKINEKVAASQVWQAQKAMEQGKTWEKNDEMGMATFDKLQKDALKEGVILQAWTGKIAQARRQCFNARIQGSAASLTKLAMIDIYNDPILNQCKTKLIIPVHDELLVECPEEYADIVEKRLPEVMINAAKRVGDDIPQSVDPYNVSRWYSDTMAATLLDEVKKLEAKGLSRDDAFAEIINSHSELPPEAIVKVLTGETPDEIIF